MYNFTIDSYTMGAKSMLKLLFFVLVIIKFWFNFCKIINKLIFVNRQIISVTFSNLVQFLKNTVKVSRNPYLTLSPRLAGFPATRGHSSKPSPVEIGQGMAELYAIPSLRVISNMLLFIWQRKVRNMNFVNAN